MGKNVDCRTNNDGPSGSFVESNVLVEWDDVVKGTSTKDGNEVAANGEEDVDDVNVENKGGSTSDGEGNSKKLP